MQVGRKFPINFERYFLSAVILGILVILYAPLIIHWYDGWLHKNISIEHEYFSHGLIGLPFAAYIAWTNRKRWQRLSDREDSGAAKPLGAVFLLIAGVFYLSGLPDPVNLSLPFLLVGLCLWLKGFQGLKSQAFPL